MVSDELPKRASVKKDVDRILVSCGVAGVPLYVMGKGPVPATLKALDKANLKVKDTAYWKINEAFAIVTLHAIHKLGIEPERVNVKGGAISHRSLTCCYWGSSYGSTFAYTSASWWGLRSCNSLYRQWAKAQ